MRGGEEGDDGSDSTQRDASGELSDETIARLRSRAEQLRASREIRQPAEPEESAEPAEPAGPAESEPAELGDEREDDDPFHDVVADPETTALLERWAEEDRDESVEPRHNWSSLVAVLVIAAIVGLGAAGAWVLIRGSAEDTATGPAAGGPTDDTSVLEDDAPSLEDLTSDVTLPPGPDAGLQVAARGVTVVPDRFDESAREGTFAVVVENPHERWLAQGVQVSVTFLDESGAPLGEDSGFVEVVLPAQRVAVASLFFDAPIVPVADITVAVDVARWRETGPVEGGFTITDVETTEAEFSGVRTTFQLRSDFDEVLTDVGVTAVYKAADGRIIGGYDTFVERLEPGVPTPAQIDLLANVDPAAIAATELYPTAAFGSIPGD